MTSAAAPTRLRLGTATPGGGFPLYGGVLAEVVRAEDPTLLIEPRNTNGSTENVPLLETGELDLALVQGEVLHESRSGLGREPVDLRIVAAMYPTAGMFVTQSGSPWRSISDLRGRRVVFGARGSGLVILARYVLDGIGLSQEGDFDAVFLDRAQDGPTMIAEGSAEALWGAGIGWPGFAKVAGCATGARFIAPNADERALILERHRFLKPMTTPADAYPGQPEPIESVGSWSCVVARPGLDDDVAYRLARALHRGEARFAAALDQARETRTENIAVAAPDLEAIHPGVRRYLRDAGLG